MNKFVFVKLDMIEIFCVGSGVIWLKLFVLLLVYDVIKIFFVVYFYD